MRNILGDTITYGIDTHNRWSVLKKIGNPTLKGVRTERLIAENLDIEDQYAITKIIGDGYGKYGIAITLNSGRKPVTHATIVDGNLVDQFLLAPSLLVAAFRDTFRVNNVVLKRAFGDKGHFQLSSGICSRVIQLSIRTSFARKSITINVLDNSSEIEGLFGLLGLIWGLLPTKSRTRLTAIYPAKVDANSKMMLLSSKKVSHASDALASATNFKIVNRKTRVFSVHYQSLFDFLRTLRLF